MSRKVLSCFESGRIRDIFIGRIGDMRVGENGIQ